MKAIKSNGSNELDIYILNTGKVELGNNYLKIKTELNDNESKTIFQALQNVKGACLWWAGDFINAVEGKKGEVYAKAFELSDYVEGTLYNAKRVCKAFPPDKRFKLSYSHHYEVLGLCKKDVDKASEFLKIAEADKMSVKEIRKFITLTQATKKLPAETNELKPTFTDVGYLQFVDYVNSIIRYLESLSLRDLQIVGRGVSDEIERMLEVAREKLK